MSESGTAFSTLWLRVWGYMEERIFEKASQELTVLGKKLEGKDRDLILDCLNLPQIIFFTKGMSMYCFFFF